MDNPRPEKAAVVEEVRARFEGSAASVVTEYRGLSVADLAQLRKSLGAAGGDYKVFKNTLVKRAIDSSAYAPLGDLFTGPSAIAFVQRDIGAVAKALRDFSRANAHLVVKGGLLDGAVLTPAQLGALADLPSREVLLSKLAGAIQAPLAAMASVLSALPRNLVYGLSALVEKRGGVPVETPPEGSETDAAPETETDAAPEADTDAAPEAEPEAAPEAETESE